MKNLLIILMGIFSSTSSFSVSALAEIDKRRVLFQDLREDAIHVMNSISIYKNDNKGENFLVEGWINFVDSGYEWFPFKVQVNKEVGDKDILSGTGKYFSAIRGTNTITVCPQNLDLRIKVSERSQNGLPSKISLSYRSAYFMSSLGRSSINRSTFTDFYSHCVPGQYISSEFHDTELVLTPVKEFQEVLEFYPNYRSQNTSSSRERVDWNKAQDWVANYSRNSVKEGFCPSYYVHDSIYGKICRKPTPNELPNSN